MYKFFSKVYINLYFPYVVIHLKLTCRYFYCRNHSLLNYKRYFKYIFKPFQVLIFILLLWCFFPSYTSKKFHSLCACVCVCVHTQICFFLINTTIKLFIKVWSQEFMLDSFLLNDVIFCCFYLSPECFPNLPISPVTFMPLPHSTFCPQK
jgi:hypothetical protein